MKLRDHPMMISKSGFKTWPPRWTTTHPNKDDKPIGEVGTLESVLISELIDNKVFMFMRYQGFRYLGFLGFDEVPFGFQIYRLLKANVGRSIKEIAHLDVSHLT